MELSGRRRHLILSFTALRRATPFIQSQFNTVSLQTKSFVPIVSPAPPDSHFEMRFGFLFLALLPPRLHLQFFRTVQAFRPACSRLRLRTRLRALLIAKVQAAHRTLMSVAEAIPTRMMFILRLRLHRTITARTLSARPVFRTRPGAICRWARRRPPATFSSAWTRRSPGRARVSTSLTLAAITLRLSQAVAAKWSRSRVAQVSPIGTSCRHSDIWLSPLISARSACFHLMYNKHHYRYRTSAPFYLLSYLAQIPEIGILLISAHYWSTFVVRYSISHICFTSDWVEWEDWKPFAQCFSCFIHLYAYSTSTIKPLLPGRVLYIARSTIKSLRNYSIALISRCSAMLILLSLLHLCVALWYVLNYHQQISYSKYHISFVRLSMCATHSRMHCTQCIVQ